MAGPQSKRYMPLNAHIEQKVWGGEGDGLAVEISTLLSSANSHAGGAHFVTWLVEAASLLHRQAWSIGWAAR